MSYASVVSQDSVLIYMTLEQNQTDLLACDIQNDYLTEKCREKIYIIAIEEFCSEVGSIMIVNIALYILKSLVVAFRDNLAQVFI